MQSASPLPLEPAKRPQCETEAAGPPPSTAPGPCAGSHEKHEKRQPQAPSEATCRILFLDDDPDRARAFLGRHPHAVWVQTAAECIDRLAESWNEVHLDHDLGGEIFVDSTRTDCGMQVVRWLCTQANPPLPDTWFFVHSHNGEAAALMVQTLRQHGYQAVYRPFGIDLLAWFAEQPDDEPGPPSAPEPARPACPPAPAPASAPASTSPGWLARQLRRLRRTAPPRPDADQVDLHGHGPSRVSGNHGAE